MDIGVPLKELGAIDIEALSDAILSLDDEAWNANNYRQQKYRQHRATKSIVLLFTDNDDWPDITVTREIGWDLLSSVACPLMESILAEHYPPGGNIIRAVVANLPPGQIIETHSVSAGLDYPGVGPEHAFLKEINRAEYVAINDEEALEAFRKLNLLEGILPALESAHAIAYGMKLAAEMAKNETIVINLSGRGDKDIPTVARIDGISIE